MHVYPKEGRADEETIQTNVIEVISETYVDYKDNYSSSNFDKEFDKNEIDDDSEEQLPFIQYFPRKYDGYCIPWLDLELHPDDHTPLDKP